MAKQKKGKYDSKKSVLVFLIVAVCAIVFIAYWPSLSAKAMCFDDNEYLVTNRLVQNPSISSAKCFFSEILNPSTVEGYYQPLAMISLMLDYSFGGRADNLMPFHLTSLALHAANVALIIVLLYLLFGQPWTAAALGLLFGLHPMTVDSTAWIAERKTVLAAFFALLCLIAYVRYAQKGGWKIYLGCFLLYLLAVISKPASTPIPALMLLMDFWPLKRLKLRTLFEKIPFLLLGIVSSVITYISQSRTAGIIEPGSIERIFFIFCHNTIFYIYKMVLPINLSSYYRAPEPLNLSQPMVLAGVIGTCILVPLLLISLKWTRAAFTGWLFFLIAILPAMQLIGVTNVIAADRFVYLPSLGFLILLASFLNWFRISANIASYKARSILVFTIVLVLGCGEAMATRKYLVHWRDSVTLYKYMLSLDPKAPKLHYSLGIVYDREGRYQEAANAYEQAIAIRPNYADAFNNLGLDFERLGRFQEAINVYQQAIKIRPNYDEAHNNLGVVYGDIGLYQDSIKAFTEAIRSNPDFAEAYCNIGNAYANLGRYQDAIESFLKAVQIKPDFAEAYYNLGCVYGNLGLYQDAIAAFTQAIQIKPDYIEARQALELSHKKFESAPKQTQRE